MTLSFYGGAREVTGANYLLESGKTKILIDCGLFQGGAFAGKNNFEEFPYHPPDIQAVFVTHGHIDHVGRIPRLFAKGFSGKVICTPPTRDLVILALEDGQGIVNDEAKKDNHAPLYTEDDVARLKEHFTTIGFDELFSAGPFEVRFFDAGHILGSSIIEIRARGKTILFTGDLGNSPSPLFSPPTVFEEADYLVMESVYGDRTHEKSKPRQDLLEDVVEDTVKRGGVLMIPAFALERTQEILYDLDVLISEGRVPQVPVFVDSPLAIKATQIYKEYRYFYNRDVQEKIQRDDKLFEFPGLVFAESVEESKGINEVESPKIIIAGSGMSQGGRILYHEARYLRDPASTILFAGYQVAGSRGREVQSGASSVEIFGERVAIKCQKATIGGFSAHADQEDLMNWVRPMRHSIKTAFLVQGEERSAKALSFQLKDFLGVDTVIPEKGQEVTLA